MHSIFLHNAPVEKISCVIFDFFRLDFSLLDEDNVITLDLAVFRYVKCQQAFLLSQL